MSYLIVVCEDKRGTKLMKDVFNSIASNLEKLRFHLTNSIHVKVFTLCQEQSFCLRNTLICWKLTQNYWCLCCTSKLMATDTLKDDMVIEHQHIWCQCAHFLIYAYYINFVGTINPSLKLSEEYVCFMRFMFHCCNKAICWSSTICWCPAHGCILDNPHPNITDDTAVWN